MLRILKVSLIDWCYRLNRRDGQQWAPFIHTLNTAIAECQADIAVIERNSFDWHQDFIRYFGHAEYSEVFINTAQLDSRLGIQGGTTLLIRKNTSHNIELAESLNLPSAKPQFDGGQPTSIPVITVNGIQIAIGCMPQNLGRECSIQQLHQYNDFLRGFWGDGSNQDIIAVPVWDADANYYDVHVWQTRYRDAVNDDRAVIDFTRQDSTISIVEMFQEYHKEHCVIPQPFMTQLRLHKPRINPLRVCSNIPGITVTLHDVQTKIDRVSDTSLVQCIELDHMSF